MGKSPAVVCLAIGCVAILLALGCVDTPSALGLPTRNVHGGVAVVFLIGQRDPRGFFRPDIVGFERGSPRQPRLKANGDLAIAGTTPPKTLGVAPAFRYIFQNITANARFLCLSGLLACFATASSFGLTAPGIYPTADAFVSSANPGNNYGAAGALEVSAAGLAKGEFDTFARFNLATTKSYFDAQFGANNWTIQSITLQLTASAPNNAIFNTSAAGMFSVLLTQSNAFVEGAGSPNAPDTTTANAINFNNRNTYLSAANDQSVGAFPFGGATTGATT